MAELCDIGVRPADRDCARASSPYDGIKTRGECLSQILAAFQDIADLDDIHQAAERLDAVQAWIRQEAMAAAADPIFADAVDSEFSPHRLTGGTR